MLATSTGGLWLLISSDAERELSVSTPKPSPSKEEWRRMPSSSEKIAVRQRLPWRTWLSLTVYDYLVNTACRPDGSINRFFVDLFLYKVPPSPQPLRGVATSDVLIDPSRDLWFRLYVPAATTTCPPNPTVRLPVILFFHGGGFGFFYPSTKPYDEFCRRLAREFPAIVVSVNYRLSPEHRFPSAYEDGLDALKYLDDDQSFPESGDRRRCFIVGDSAGANLAHHVAVRASKCEFRVVQVVGLVAIQPFLGGEERVESETRMVGAPLVSMQMCDHMWRAFLPEGSDRDHPAANVFGPKSGSAGIGEISRLERFPAATMVFVGGLDPLQDRQREYYEGLKRCGKQVELVEYPNAIHSFYGFPEFPEAAEFITAMRGFVATH